MALVVFYITNRISYLSATVTDCRHATAKETLTLRKPGPLSVSAVKGVMLDKKKCPPVSNHKILAFLCGRLR